MSEPFMGEIRMFAGNFAPKGWAFCNGDLVSIAENSALYALLGTAYGGDGRSTFGLPDMRGRVAVHAGRLPGGGNYERGQRGGAEYIQLSTAQMPSHEHNVTVKAKATASTGNQGSPVGHAWASDGAAAAFTYSDATPDQDMKDGSVVVEGQDAGGSQPHENRPPYQTVNYIIAMVGLFPSRN